MCQNINTSGQLCKNHMPNTLVERHDFIKHAFYNDFTRNRMIFSVISSVCKYMSIYQTFKHVFPTISFQNTTPLLNKYLSYLTMLLLLLHKWSPYNVFIHSRSRATYSWKVYVIQVHHRTADPGFPSAIPALPTNTCSSKWRYIYMMTFPYN